MGTSSIGTRRVLLALSFALGAPAMAADLYQSAGDAGEPVFSDRPSSTGPSQRITVEPPPVSEDPEAARKEVEATHQAVDRLAAERRAARASEAAAREARAAREASCAAARSRLTQLTSQPPNRRLVPQPDGTARRVDWEEMQQLISDAERQVQVQCGGAQSGPTATGQPVPPELAGSTRQKGAGSSERVKSTGSTTREKTP